MSVTSDVQYTCLITPGVFCSVHCLKSDIMYTGTPAWTGAHVITFKQCCVVVHIAMINVCKGVPSFIKSVVPYCCFANHIDCNVLFVACVISLF